MSQRASYLLATTAVLLTLGACRSLSIMDGSLPCSKEGACPAPYRCVDKVCRSAAGSGGGQAGGGGLGGMAGSTAAAGSGGSSGVIGAGGTAGSTTGTAGGTAGVAGGTAGAGGGAAGGTAGAAGGGTAGAAAGMTGAAGGGAAGAAAGMTGAAGGGAAGAAAGMTGAAGQAPPPKVVVTIQRTGQGTVTGTNVSCVDASCPVSIDVGANLTLQANASQGWHLQQWSGCPSVSGTMCTLTNVGAALQVTVTFVQDNATFSIVKAGNGTGTVTATWAGGGSLNCGTACSAAIAPNTVVTLQATTATGSTAQWAAPCSGSGTCMVTVAAGGTMAKATFTLDRYLLTAALGGPTAAGSVLSTTGGVDINCGATCSALVDYGTSVQLVASPSATGVFSAWTGCTSTSGATCTVKIMAAITATAAFKLKTGAACSAPSDCVLGFCLNNVCCGSACNGVCEQTACAAGSGACAPKPARTACGSFAGADFMSTMESPQDVLETCDGAGHCGAPKLKCGTSGSPCALTSSTSCCDVQGDYANLACRPASSCYETILNCGGAADCPLNQVCCLFNDFVLYKSYCAATCPSVQVCAQGNSQECLQPAATCQQFAGFFTCN